MEVGILTNVEVEGGLGEGSFEGGLKTGEDAKQKNWGNRRLYVGNISNEVTEEMLAEFFQENNLKADAIQKITLRTGYAFVECVDHDTAAAAAERCNMKTFMNTVLRVEVADKPAYRPRGAYRQRSKTQLFKTGIPGGVPMDGSGDQGFVPQNRATGWKTQPGNAAPLLDMDFAHNPIQAQSFNAYQNMMQSAAEPPLKILVPNEFVGAVIGRGGSTIRQISKSTGARLDIFRNCSRYDVPEKPVTIFGPPEKASKACRRILEIILSEAEADTEEGQRQGPPRPDLCLRMFAQDSYIGRVIGKGGSIIKKIMEETQTKIHISTQSDFLGKEAASGPTRYLPPVLERLITVRGSIDGMCRAEEVISEKLREAYQNEIQLYENGYSLNGMSGQRSYAQSTDEGYQRIGEARRKFASRSPFTFSANQANPTTAQYIPGGTYSTYSNGPSAYLNTFNGNWSPDSQNNLSRPERVHMYIPEDVVGALIGRRGANVKQIINQTGASVKIMEDKLILDDNPVRRVVIHGVIDSLFKAQYLIYDKVVEEGKGPANHQIDEIRLTVEMSVPSDMVGRLIGRQGLNIRDIQKNYLCRVKFMTEPDVTLPHGNPGETFVRITGNYNAFLGAQKQIREMLVKLMTRFFHPPAPGLRRKELSDGIPSENTSGNSDDIDMAREDMI